MTKMLEDLAEVVREAYRAGFIAACKWPKPVSQDVDSSAYNKEFNAWSFSVREKHAAVLDAEGDGGAHQCEMCKKLQGQIDALHTVLDVRESRTHHATITDMAKRLEAADALLKDVSRYLDPRHYTEVINRIDKHLRESGDRRTPERPE